VWVRVRCARWMDGRVRYAAYCIYIRYLLGYATVRCFTAVEQSRLETAVCSAAAVLVSVRFVCGADRRLNAGGLLRGYWAAGVCVRLCMWGGGGGQG
jgi:hypothetical protein